MGGSNYRKMVQRCKCLTNRFKLGKNEVKPHDAIKKSTEDGVDGNMLKDETRKRAEDLLNNLPGQVPG